VIGTGGREEPAVPRGRLEFRAQGRLSKEVAGEVDELMVAQAAPETVLSGEVVDNAHLDGVLARF
jgi:hypothetical protein